ncbi:MAG TPA: ABC transporter ATP-binding protein [Thermoflexia bacterium]|nr:ABC transporter ATP-binding protein [Thermoflexia bacterium]
MSIAMRFEDYSWRYSRTSEPALKNVNLEIAAGAVVGIIGPNGSGKTSLAYSMNGLIPNQYNGIRTGAVYVLGKEVTTIPQAQLCQQVGLVFSDPEAQFTAMTVEDEVIFGMENMGLTIAQIKQRLDWVVPLTEIEPLMDKPPYEVSGGQKQRVALASVLGMRPPIMVLDEPTSMLDPMGRQRVFEVLGKLKREYQSTIIVVEHSLENLVPLADLMILVYHGEVLLVAETEPFFEQLGYLMKHDVFPPGVLEFFYQLKVAGHYPAAWPLPQSVAAGAARLRALFEEKK